MLRSRHCAAQSVGIRKSPSSVSLTPRNWTRRTSLISMWKGVYDLEGALYCGLVSHLGLWVYGNLVRNGNTCQIVAGDVAWLVDSDTVVRWTKAFDSAGNRIFEGDRGELRHPGGELVAEGTVKRMDSDGFCFVSSGGRTYALGKVRDGGLELFVTDSRIQRTFR